MCSKKHIALLFVFIKKLLNMGRPPPTHTHKICYSLLVFFPDDIYVHADLHGASSVVIKNNTGIEFFSYSNTS